MKSLAVIFRSAAINPATGNPTLAGTAGIIFYGFLQGFRLCTF